ncbi:MAG: hypothetical protein QOF51_1002 [Chloroflexota bacterium]|nr:hypothetical protein [Chloroflexota bacterium]
MSIRTLQSALGLFAVLFGTIALAVPHRFAGPAGLAGSLPVWGIALLLAGLALLSVAVLAPSPRATLVIHLGASTVLVTFLGSLALAGSATGVASFGPLAVGAVVAPFVAGRRVAPWPQRGDLYLVVVGCIGLALGAIYLFAGSRVLSPAGLAVVGPRLPWHGLAFMVGGAALLVVQLVPRLRVRYTQPVSLLASIAFLAWAVGVSWPLDSWSGAVFHGTIGLVLVVLGLFGGHLAVVDPAALRTRVGLALALTAALPVLAATSLIGIQQEADTRSALLDRQQALTGSLAHAVGDYLQLHASAVATIAGVPRLIDMPAQDQLALLRRADSVYPDITAFVLFDANGATLARSDGRITAPGGNPVYEQVRQANAPTLTLALSATLGVPLFYFGAPIDDPNGRLLGVVAGLLAPARVGQLVASAPSEGVAYLVDDRGRIAAHPDGSLLLSDGSELPPVAALRVSSDPSGSLSYGTGSGEQLATYARLPGSSWGVVVDRPAAVLLAPVRAGREAAFGALLVTMALGLAVGWLFAGRLTTSLGQVTAAARQLQGVGRSGEPMAVVLPTSAISEVRVLADAMAQLQVTLQGTMAERTAAYDQLAQAETRARFLAEAGAALASSLDYDATLRTVARLAVPTLADLCIVHLLREGSEDLEPVAIAALDPAVEEELWEINRAHYQPTRDSPNSLLARSVRDRTPVLQEEFSDAIADQISEGSAEFVRFMRKLGPTSTLAAPLTSHGEELGAILFSYTAASGRHYSPEEIALVEQLARRCATAIDNARLHHRAQEAVQIREEFLSVAAHELRTPLTSLRLATQMALRQLEREPEQAPERLFRMLRTADEQTRRLSLLVVQLLDISRLERGQLELQREEVDLVVLAGQAIDAVRPTTSRHRIELQAPAACRVSADPLRVEQVLVNLLTNAVKYSPKGGTIRVEVPEPGPGAGEVEIAVTDEGQGIPPEHREQIFERFFQIVTNDRETGLGLGLYISRQIAEAHGGSLHVEEPPAGGSRFVLRLPVGAPPVPGA